MAKRKLTKADRERLRRMGENAERTRRLAERAQAALDQRREELGIPPDPPLEPLSHAERLRRMHENAERTRRLAEKAQAEFDRRTQQQEH
jgi:hypothetical protein